VSRPAKTENHCRFEKLQLFSQVPIKALGFDSGVLFFAFFTALNKVCDVDVMQPMLLHEVSKIIPIVGHLFDLTAGVFWPLLAARSLVVVLNRHLFVESAKLHWTDPFFRKDLWLSPAFRAGRVLAYLRAQRRQATAPTSVQNRSYRSRDLSSLAGPQISRHNLRNTQYMEVVVRICSLLVAGLRIEEGH
jgi:hypothetical protein